MTGDRAPGRRADPGTLPLGLMLVLTFSTGVVDAVGYLGLDRVFTGNMTGNVVILGMALTGADDLPVRGPLVALAAFMVGAVIAGRVLRGVPSGWTHRTTALLAAVGMLILAVTVPTLALEDMGEVFPVVVTAALGLAMGMQAATARHLSVKDVTTVVVTSTIAGLAADSMLGGGTNQPWRRRAGAVVLIGAGAATGALALRVHLGLGMLLAVVLSLGVAAVGGLARPRSGAAGDEAQAGAGTGA
ncbi:YoaK family protein [Georgenia sp. SYP-B2076]|uniref:YoaK family protein n=1 Tax=Georgenia sp. SYP-B2076 TaxID=2495881 RepID=UPI000F8E378D|nr:YoaK family protein [Georgenia sp. SYP-B2076]